MHKIRCTKHIIILFSALAAIVIIFYAYTFMNVFVLPNQRTTAEKRIISAADRQIDDEGMCVIALDEIFDDIDWDTVSIFVSGNRQILKEELHIDVDIADSGIVFSHCSEPVLTDTSVYDFLHNSNDEVTYSLSTDDADLYYISVPKENASVQVTKYRDSHGDYRYIVTFAEGDSK